MTATARQAHPKPVRRDRLASDRARREARILAMAELRHDALERDQFRCVCCATDLHRSGVEVHHLVSGNGKRREHESLGTLASTCPGCHGRAHAADLSALLALGRWARTHGSAEAREEIRRRLAKMETSLGAFNRAAHRAQRKGGL